MLNDINSDDFKIRKDHKTTAWKEGKPICEKIIEALLSEPGCDFLSQPPSPNHPYYSEIMEDYIDFLVI